jgi:hypothetical protein
LLSAFLDFPAFLMPAFWSVWGLRVSVLGGLDFARPHIFAYVTLA